VSYLQKRNVLRIYQPLVGLHGALGNANGLSSGLRKALGHQLIAKLATSLCAACRWLRQLIW
jgi:hypothetical protein